MESGTKTWFNIQSFSKLNSSNLSLVKTDFWGRDTDRTPNLYSRSFLSRNNWNSWVNRNVRCRGWRWDKDIFRLIILVSKLPFLLNNICIYTVDINGLIQLDFGLFGLIQVDTCWDGLTQVDLGWFRLIRVYTFWYELIQVDKVDRVDSGWFGLNLVDSCWFWLILVDSGLFGLIQFDSVWFGLIRVDSSWF